VEERTGALAVAQRAVVEMQGKNFVWIVDDANKAAMRSVNVGPRIGSDWIIDNGLKRGDRVVVEGLQMLTEGGSVQPTTALANANPAPGKE
jgi:membrane fusion protein (multidrug efflux system)